MVGTMKRSTSAVVNGSSGAGGPPADGWMGLPGRPGGAAADGPGLFGCSGPPEVLRGAKCAQRVGRESVQSGIDWVAFSGPADLLEAVTEWMSQRFGEFVEQRGMRFFHHQRRWGIGAFVQFGHVKGCDGSGGDDRDDLVNVVLPGGVMSCLDAQTRIDWLRELVGLGLKGTRLDLAADFFRDGGGPAVDLVERVASSCAAGQLCGARRWKAHFGDRGLQGVEMGRRGREGSGRFVRVYDKGLEQGGDRGDWQRFEAEFTGSVAEAVIARLLAAECWVTEFQSLTFGSIDFRERGRDRHLSARPRVAWWSQFIEKVRPVCVRAVRAQRSLSGRITWIRKAVLPGILAMGRVSAVDFVELLRGWCDGVPERAIGRALRAAPVAELAFACATGSGSGWRKGRAYAA